MTRFNSLLALAATAALMTTQAAAPAFAGAFSSFGGVWRGSGAITLSGGQKERLTCKAYYTPKESGSRLGIAITCSSQANKIQLRANLDSSGSSVSGRACVQLFRKAHRPRQRFQDQFVDFRNAAWHHVYLH